MNRILIRILSGMFFALLAAITVMIVIITPFYGHLFKNPTWYPIRQTVGLVQYIIDNTAPEKIEQEIDNLSTVLNRRIQVVPIDDDVPEKVRQGLSNGGVTYGRTMDGKMIFYAPVQHGREVALIDPSFQQYKPLVNPFLSVISFIIMSIAALLIGIWLAYPVNRHLNKIETAAKKISKGDRTIRIKVISADLIGNVERCFNQMADRIQSLVTNRQILLNTIAQKFQVPVAQIDGYLKDLRCKDNISEVKGISQKIDKAVNDIELMVSDLLTEGKIRESGFRDLCLVSGKAPGTPNDPWTVNPDRPRRRKIHPVAAVYSGFKSDVMKFILRISLGILVFLLLRHLYMLATPQIFYKYTNTDPSWYPIHTIATLIQRAVERTPMEELPSRLEILESTLNREIDLIPAVQAANLFTRTSQQEFAGGMTYGVFKGRDVFSAPVQDGANILMIDPAFALCRQHPSIVYHSLTLAIEFMFTALFGIVLSVPIIRNLKRLMDGIESIRHEDLNARVDIPLNKPIGTLAGHLNDMAERIQSLLNHQKDLIQAVVHEIRTPVSRIRFHLEMLMDADDKSEINKRSADIEEEIKEMNMLVRELSDFTALDAMNDGLALEPVPIHDTLSEIIAYHQKANPSIHILLINPEGDYLKINAHLVYFKRAIHNMLSNAVRYALDNVYISYRSSGNEISIDICDDGPGIPIDARKAIFEPFSRLDNSRDRRSGGFGLGLAIVKRIISLHGGTISIADNSPQGARVTTWWPSFNHFHSVS